MSINFGHALKAKQLRQFFNEKGRIYIVVDATSDAVNLPDFLKGDAGLRLVLNTRMPQSITIKDSFLESNFSFSGVSHHCVIPMGCIWAAYEPNQDLDSGLMWESDIPETIVLMMKAMQALDGDENLIEKDAVVEQPESQEKSVEVPAFRGKRVGHLRVVK